MENEPAPLSSVRLDCNHNTSLLKIDFISSPSRPAIKENTHTAKSLFAYRFIAAFLLLFIFPFTFPIFDQHSYNIDLMAFSCLFFSSLPKVNWCRSWNWRWPTPRCWLSWPSPSSATTSSPVRWGPATLAPAWEPFSSSWPFGSSDASPPGKNNKQTKFGRKFGFPYAPTLFVFHVH